MTKNDILRATLHIERAMESRTGNFGKPITTMAELEEIYDGYSRCRRGETITTIQANVAEFYRKYKFDVQPEGIGWKITSPIRVSE